jgi:5-methylcytosine-specific restriction protein A
VIRHALDVLQGKAKLGQRRSKEWPKVRAAHLATHPTCEVCGGTERLEVHHIRPVHFSPQWELRPGNLITLCEAKRNGVTCHQFVGHLGDYRSWNPDVVTDAKCWRKKLKDRPR